MIVYVLFVHKKSVLKRKVCIIFIKNIKKNIFSGFFTFLGGFLGFFGVGFFGGFFRVGFFGCFFLGGYFIANPALRRRRRPPTRPSSRRWETRPSGCGDRRTAPSRRSASRSSPRARFFSSDGPREYFFTQQLSRDYRVLFLAKNTYNMCYVEDNPKIHAFLKVYGYLWRIALRIRTCVALKWCGSVILSATV